MKVAQFIGLRQLAIVERAQPERPKEHEVLVRIDRVGVCGSDVHYYTRGRIGDQVIAYPATVGHECAGTVIEVGSEVIRLTPGDRVAVDPAFFCGSCDQCRAGRFNTCRNLQFMGCPGEADGAAAEYHVFPESNCLAVPDSITLDQATLIEPLTIGLHAARLGGVCQAVRMAILGAGPIGLSVLLCAKALAEVDVFMTDLLDDRLRVAQECGADWTGNPRDQDVVASISEREPWGLDLVFECSGDPACLDQGMQLLTPGGSLVLVGIPSVEQVGFDIHTMRRKELTLKNVRRQKDCIGPVIQMIDEGRLDVSPLLTHRYPLARIRDAFELVADYRDGVIKAMLDLSEAE